MSASDLHPNKSRWWPQISLRTLLLLTACAAVWSGVWIGTNEMERLQTILQQTRSLVRELVIHDRTRLAVIRQDEHFFDENKWQVYVPESGCTIHLVTTALGREPVTSGPSEASAKLEYGVHTVELKVEELSDKWLVTVGRFGNRHSTATAKELESKPRIRGRWQLRPTN